jgi:hypothetical protein
MNAIVILVEGDLDLQLVSKVAPMGVLVERAYGKFNLAGVVDGYKLARGTTDTSRVYGFRDRDFDFPEPKTDTFESKGKVYVSVRRTIENYLLTEENLNQYLLESQASLDLIRTKHLEGSILIEAAREIRNYQAARYALGQTRQENTLRTTWLRDSDKLPQKLDVDSCIEEALKYLETYRDKASVMTNVEEFKKTFEEYLDKFDDAFFENGMHELHFQGKNLAKAILRKYQKFPMANFLVWAIDHFDHRKFPDFSDFIEKLQQELSQQ